MGFVDRGVASGLSNFFHAGVAGPDGIKKDPEKVRAFISAATGLAPDECRTRRDRAKLERIASQS